jgi:hypothetical protein
MSKKIILLMLLSVAFTKAALAQLPVVNNKGTKVLIDSSKWKLTAGNIVNKNSGNIGIGVGTPLYKLDVDATSNPLRLGGVQTGLLADSIITIQNGVIKKIAPTDLVNVNTIDSTTATNGLNLIGKDVRLGGNLNQATTITNNSNDLTFATGGAALKITGLQTGLASDSIVTVQNGVVKKIASSNFISTNANDSTTATNGLNLVGKDVRLGGNLTQATTITNNSNDLTFATGGAALNITGLTVGANTDSILTINTATGRVNRISLPNTNRPDSTTATNGLNLVGKDVRLGGNLTQGTTINNNEKDLTFATGGAVFNITGLQNGVAATDSLVTVQNGLIRKLAPINSFLINRNDSTTATNGLNLVGKDVRFGGNLTQATTITNNSNALTFATGGAAFNITGLAAGANTDSLVTINTSTGRLNRINLSHLNKSDSTTANNGLSLTGKNIQLGGNLLQPTTVTSNAQPLTIATGGTAFNITGLPSGASTDSLVTINNTTGQLRKIPAPNLQGSLVELFDGAGTQTLTNTFTNLTFGTTTIADAGYTIAAGTVAISTAGLYKITYRVTVRVTNNTASGCEFQLTNGGVALPGTLGYTFQQNNNRSQGTVNVVKLVNLTAGSNIAVQGRRYSTAGNLTLTANGSSLLIERIR